MTTENAARCEAKENGQPSAHLDRPGDALALVQHTFGYMPQESLVLIGLAGGSSGGHLRVDLGAGAGDPYAMARQCAEWLAGPDSQPSPEAALGILFTQHAPSPLHTELYDRLVHTLAGCLDSEYGVELLHVWHAGGGAVRNYTCRDEACCAYPGLSIAAELETSLNRLPQLSVASGAPCGPSDLLAEFLNPLHQPSEASKRVVRRVAKSAAASAEVEQELTLWAQALTRSRRTEPSRWLHTSEDEAAALLRTLASKRVRDALVPLASVGYLSAVAGTLLHEDLRDDPGIARLEDAELLGRLAPRLPERVDAATLDGLLEDYSNCWIGATGSRPDWQGIEALEALLRELLPYAEGDAREAALTLKAWIEWVKGRSSVSSAAVDLVRREFGGTSECTMAELVDRFSGVFGVAPWARVKVHSYSWWKSDQAASPKTPPHFGNDR